MAPRGHVVAELGRKDWAVSHENVEIVQRFSLREEGHDMMPGLRTIIERLGRDPQPEAVLAVWAEHPAFQHFHPDIEWDAPAADIRAARGIRDLYRWWAEWADVWESYTFRVLEWRDLGDWVMTREAIHAVGRQGIALEVEVFQIWQVRDEKIAVVRIFVSENAALSAAGFAQ